MTTETTPKLTCGFDISGHGSWRRRECGLPAVRAVKAEAWKPAPYEGRCARHAGIDQRRKYGRLEVVDLTPEIVAELTKAARDRAEAARVERERRSEEAKSAHARWVEQRRVEASWQYSVTRDDAEEFATVGGQVVESSHPRWRVHPKVAARGMGIRETTIELKHEESDVPVVIDVHGVSGELDINQARALVRALQRAIAEAEKEGK